MPVRQSLSDLPRVMAETLPLTSESEGDGLGECRTRKEDYPWNQVSEWRSGEPASGPSCRESIMKTGMGLGIVVGLLVFGSVARAEPVEGDSRLVPEPVKVAPAPDGPPAGCSHCTSCTPCPKRHRLIEWLTYRPLYRPGLCGCYKEGDPRPAPVYTWFLDFCGAGGGNAYPLRVPSAYPTCNTCR